MNFHLPFTPLSPILNDCSLIFLLNIRSCQLYHGYIDTTRYYNRICENNRPTCQNYWCHRSWAGLISVCTILEPASSKIVKVAIHVLQKFSVHALCGHGGMLQVELRLHDAIYRLRFCSNSLIHILSLSSLHNNVASIQKNRGDKSHRAMVASDCVQMMSFIRYSENPYKKNLEFWGSGCCSFLSRNYDFKYQVLK